MGNADKEWKETLEQLLAGENGDAPLDEVEDALGEDGRPRRPIVMPEQVLEEIDRVDRKTANPLQRARLKLLNTIMNRGFCASVATLPPDWRELLDEFDARFPNMTGLSAFLRERFALASLTGSQSLALGLPVLLVGPPGIGKTHAVSWLARRLGTRFQAVSCSNATNGFDLTGLSAGWGTGKLGQLGRLLVVEDCANPFVLLDELDKGDRNKQDNIMDKLHAILEPGSAREFHEEFLDIELDLSACGWVATANSTEHIPAPILDRFTVIELAELTADQVRAVIPYVYRDMVANAEWGCRFAPELDEGLAHLLARVEGMNARRAGNVLQTAAARAAIRCAEDDSMIEIQCEDLFEALCARVPAAFATGPKPGASGYLQ